MRCVTDANIWIDLDEGGLLGRVFELGHAFLIPDLVLAEVTSLDAGFLASLGLEVRSLTGEQVMEVIRLGGLYPRPSRQDLATLVLADALDAILVSGDKELRAAAEAEDQEVHGTLWLLDRMVEGPILDPQEATRSLNLMIRAGRRLPTSEVNKRLSDWQRR